MRNNILSYIMICALSIFYSCSGGDSIKEQGVAIVLNMPSNDTVEDIDIRVFNNNGILINLYSFATLEDVLSTLLPLSAGDYTLVATVNANKSFTITEKIGETTLDELLFTINAPYSSSSHAYYGVTKVTAVDGASTQATIDGNRIFSEVKFTIKNLSDDIRKVEMTIQNTAKGFYPAVQKLTAEYNSTYLGEVDVIDNVAKFPSLYLMSSVTIAQESKSDAKINTTAEFTLHYVNGDTVTIVVILPEMNNGGTYTPEIDFEILRTGIIVDITDIIGWVDGSENEGEILNPI